MASTLSCTRPPSSSAATAPTSVGRWSTAATSPGRNPEKWPEFCAPDPSYHGLVFEEALRPIGNIAFIIHMRTHWLRDTGACMSPFAAFLFLQGLETLHLRMPRHCENALRIARWLEQNPAVQWVNYPGLPKATRTTPAREVPGGRPGSDHGLRHPGGMEAGKKLINQVQLFSHLANIGDAKSLIIHPASTTHQQLSAEEQPQAGVTPEYIRLSIGIEDATDLIADLDQAIRASQLSRVARPSSRSIQRLSKDLFESTDSVPQSEHPLKSMRST